MTNPPGREATKDSQGSFDKTMPKASFRINADGLFEQRYREANRLVRIVWEAMPDGSFVRTIHYDEI